MKLYFLLFF